jgi:hypothetical protein
MNILYSIKEEIYRMLPVKTLESDNIKVDLTEAGYENVTNVV